MWRNIKYKRLSNNLNKLCSNFIPLQTSSRASFWYHKCMNIFKTIPFNIKKWFLYLLLAFFIAVTLLACFFFFPIDQEEKEKFKSKFLAFIRKRDLKETYILKKLNSMVCRSNMPIAIKKELRVRRFSLIFFMSSLLSKEEIGKNYDTAEELAQHYNSWLVAPFFERAFTDLKDLNN